MKSKLSIIIPVYNEAKTIDQLLQSVWMQELDRMEKEIVIIESNSTDDSRKIVEEFAREKNASVPGSVQLILQDRPEGKGKAVRQGLGLATGEIILIQDGDLEYDVRDYPILVNPILEGKTNFVLGSRHLSAGSWKIRKFGRSQVKSSFMNLGGAIIS